MKEKNIRQPRDISPFVKIIQKFHRIINKIFNNHQFNFIVNRKLVFNTFLDQSNWINHTRKNLGMLAGGIRSQRLFPLISRYPH